LLIVMHIKTISSGSSAQRTYNLRKITMTGKNLTVTGLRFSPAINRSLVAG